jgi:hypothetical protein
MKFAVSLFAIVLLANAIAACPDEVNCRQCSANKDGSMFCSECENSFYNAQQKTCDKSIGGPIEHCKSYFQNEQGMVCRTCEDGYTPVKNTCVKCSTENCARCRDDQACFACFNLMKIIPNADDATKNVCSTTEKCDVENCDMCLYSKNGDLCISCKAGFSQSLKTLKCAAGLPNCLQFSEEGAKTCTKCSWGFYIAADGSCKPDVTPEPEKGSWGWLWVLLVLVIIAVAGYFAYNHFSKSQQNTDNVYLTA